MRDAPRAWRRNGVAEAETTAARGDGAEYTRRLFEKSTPCLFWSRIPHDGGAMKRALVGIAVTVAGCAMVTGGDAGTLPDLALCAQHGATLIGSPRSFQLFSR